MTVINSVSESFALVAGRAASPWMGRSYDGQFCVVADPGAFLYDKPFLIAEIGINHNGNIDIAKKLIDVSKSSGFDAVKFQKRDIEKVYSKEILETPRESPWGKTTREQKEGLEFGEKEYDVVDNYCKELDIYWFASAWDVNSLKFLNCQNLEFQSYILTCPSK